MRDFESSNQICVTPTALPIILMLSPGLPAWANLCRAYGAGVVATLNGSGSGSGMGSMRPSPKM